MIPTEGPDGKQLPSRADIHVEFVTPCFLGGADARGAPEWRGASIRGQLRWWFRAVAGGACAGSLPAVRAIEDDLFGTTTRASNLVVLPLEHPHETTFASDVERLGPRLDEKALAGAWKDSSKATLERLRLDSGPSNPLQYLGYGCRTTKKIASESIDRIAIRPGQTASFRLLQRRPLAPRHLELLRDSLWAWLHLGGIGAKCRRGFGSLRCVGIGGSLWPEGELSLTDIAAFRNGAKKLLSKTQDGPSLPEWTHLSKASRVYVAPSAPVDQTWNAAMSCVGGWLIAFRRRYGKPSDTRTYGGRSIVNRDYTWAAPGGRSRRAGIPDRAGFGLPLPFGKDGETVTWSPPSDHRRASPLLIHISRFGEAYVPILTYLPAQLIPAGKSLGFRSGPSPAKAISPEQDGIVQEFLSDLEVKQLIEAVRP